MPRAYSLDLRERIARFVSGGRSCHAAAAHFGVSVSFAVRLMATYRASGRLTPRPSGGRRHAKLDPHWHCLLAWVTEQPDITMPELAGRLAATTGTSVDPAHFRGG
jgi:transposase